MDSTQIPEVTVRTAAQLGNALRRYRRAVGETQAATGVQAGIKQGAVSTLESGLQGTRLSTLFKLLAALDLELVVRKRPKGFHGPEA